MIFFATGFSLYNQNTPAIRKNSYGLHPFCSYLNKILLQEHFGFIWKRKLHLGFQLSSPTALGFPIIHLRCSYGILTVFPFVVPISRVLSRLRFHLGPTNPRPSSVPEETFPTSVYKIHNCLFATTTKICIRGTSRQDLSYPSTDTSTSLSTSRKKKYLRLNTV